MTVVLPKFRVCQCDSLRDECHDASLNSLTWWSPAPYLLRTQGAIWGAWTSSHHHLHQQVPLSDLVLSSYQNTHMSFHLSCVTLHLVILALNMLRSFLILLIVCLFPLNNQPVMTFPLFWVDSILAFEMLWTDQTQSLEFANALPLNYIPGFHAHCSFSFPLPPSFSSSFPPFLPPFLSSHYALEHVLHDIASLFPPLPCYSNLDRHYLIFDTWLPTFYELLLYFMMFFCNFATPSLC